MPVDPDHVMSIGDRLLEHYPDSFTDEFSRNKKIVQRVTDINSAHLRNRIAGYVTRNR